MFDRLPYEERAGHAKNALGKQLFELMARKKSNLAVAADVSTSAAVLQLAEQVDIHLVCSAHCSSNMGSFAWNLK